MIAVDSRGCSLAVLNVFSVVSCKSVDFSRFSEAQYGTICQQLVSNNLKKLLMFLEATYLPAVF